MFSLFLILFLAVGAIIALRIAKKADAAAAAELNAEQENTRYGDLERERAERRAKEARHVATGLRVGAAAAGVLGLLVLFFSMTVIVEDGKVGVTKAFGEYGSETLQPGFNFKFPWESVSQIDTKVKSTSFSAEDGANDGRTSPISAQAKGGGNLALDATVQWQVEKPTADDLLREVGSNWFDIILLPTMRSCLRDAPVGLTVEEAFTTKRGEIGANALECMNTQVDEYGINVVDVLMRDVDPGQAVRDAIDAKQQQEQELQRASIELEQERIRAQQEAVRAFGISNAEQIVACGGREVLDENGEVIDVKANDESTCEDAFTTEYLQWLYIQQLDKIDGVVILPPNFDGELFVQTPQPQKTEG